MVDYPEIDFQDQLLLRPPKEHGGESQSHWMMWTPSCLETYKKLGIPLKEQALLAGVEGAEQRPAEGRKVAVDAVFDSVRPLAPRSRKS